jgi:hypothetical protein
MDRDDAERRSLRGQWLLGAVVLVISLVYFAWRTPAPRSALPVQAPEDAIDITRPSSPAPSPGADESAAGSGEPSRAVATDGEVLHVDVRAQGVCWLSATSDGKRVVYRLMQPGEQQMIEMRDEIVLRVGDPAAFAFSIDGVSGRSLGRAGDAVTVRITRQNYREFLRR